MDTTLDRLLPWAPRILGIAVALFIALFALDALGPGKPVTGFLIHLLPSLTLLAIVGLAWRWPWIGGLAFIGLAIAYAMMVPHRLDWILAIGGPLLLVGLLFLWSWGHALRART